MNGMGNPDTAKGRDRELASLAEQAERLARRAHDEGDFHREGQMLAVAIFFRDCIAARPSRFRSRPTQRRRAGGVSPEGNGVGPR